MQAHTRRAIAYFIAWQAAGSTLPSIFDFQTRRRYLFFARTDGSLTDILDQDRGDHITGYDNGRGAALLHHGNHRHFTVCRSGQRFDGYDFDGSQTYVGTFIGNIVELWDLGEGRPYWFSP